MLKKLLLLPLLLFIFSCDDDSDNNGLTSMLPSVGTVLIYENYDLDLNNERVSLLSTDSLVIVTKTEFKGYSSLMMIRYTQNNEDNSTSIDTLYIREKNGTIYMIGALTYLSDAEAPFAGVELEWLPLYSKNSSNWDILTQDLGFYNLTATGTNTGEETINVDGTDYTARTFDWNFVLDGTNPVDSSYSQISWKTNFWYVDGITVARTLEPSTEFNDFEGSETILTKIYQ